MNVILSVVAAVLCLFVSLFASLSGNEHIAIVAQLFFKTSLFLSFYCAGKIKHYAKFILFLALILGVDLISLFAFKLGFQLGFFVGTTFIVIYILLLKDAWSQFSMNRINYRLRDLLLVLLLYSGVLVVHFIAVLPNYEGNLIMIFGQLIYIGVLFVIGFIALAYYLNSYSTKSMIFLVATLAFLVSDFLYGSMIFYEVTGIVSTLGIFMGAVGYIFVLNYFSIKEEPLLLDSDILEEIEEIKQRQIGQHI